MIDWEKSAELNNCTVEWLKARFEKYPKSNKRVWRICDGEGCDDERAIEFSQYSDLCRKCVMKTPLAREANRLRGIGQFSDPKAREEMSRIKKRFLVDNPEFLIGMVVRSTAYYENNPNARDVTSKDRTKYFSDPENRDKMSRIKKQFYLDNPDAGKEYADCMSQYWGDPEWCKAQADRVKNSNTHKLACEKFIGGFDIVNHHFIYGHDHPENHTVEITLSQHSAHHQWMIRSGLEVPHINVTEDNKDIFIRRNTPWVSGN